MNFKSGSIDQFEQLSQFTSLKEFNHHMEMWLVEHKHEFSKGERVGLKRIVRFAAKIPGVCNAKIGTMLKVIHEDYQGNGISRSTFKRMIQKAITLGIITVHETERKNGSQSSNLYIFNRFPINEPHKEENLNHHNKTINLSETKETKNINTRKETESIEKSSIEIAISKTVLDYTYTSDRVPTAFVQIVKYFFPDAKTIEEYWRMTTIAAYRNCCEKEIERVIDIAIKAFKQMIGKLKSNTVVHKPIAYFYGILDKKFREVYFEDLFEMGTNDEEDLFGSGSCVWGMLVVK
jgi:hypothetical protein